jgi:hypothetical protein
MHHIRIEVVHGIRFINGGRGVGVFGLPAGENPIEDVFVDGVCCQFSFLLVKA